MEGCEARSLFLPDGEPVWVAGQYQCESITVYAENGEMAAVPYARVLLTTGREFRVNLKHYGIELIND